MVTSTARRRWSREIDSLIDGIGFASSGPVLIHGYDPPAEGMWIDDVIPGKLGVLDRATGETLWYSPCEVGYGRGFGAGLGKDGDVIVLGPSSTGHRIVRMTLETGALLGASEIEPFDEALVDGDICVCVCAGRVYGVMPEALAEIWEYRREGERFHSACRFEEHVYVAYTNTHTGKRGVIRLDAESGEFRALVVAPSLPVIHEMTASREGLILLTREIDGALPRELVSQLLIELSQRDDGGVRDTLSILALPHDGEQGTAPLWFEVLSTQAVDDVPEVSILADMGKLYLVRGALLEVRDALTGRVLGEWTIPGLDERVAWQVREGACLLAEETRVSIFELPA